MEQISDFQAGRSVGKKFPGKEQMHRRPALERVQNRRTRPRHRPRPLVPMSLRPLVPRSLSPSVPIFLGPWVPRSLSSWSPGPCFYVSAVTYICPPARYPEFASRSVPAHRRAFAVRDFTPSCALRSWPTQSLPITTRGSVPPQTTKARTPPSPPEVTST